MGCPPEDYKRVYRIVSSRYLPFDGSGAFRWGSRWTSPGRYVVHATESYALAVLENLVHWQANRLPAGLMCVIADIPDAIRQKKIDVADLPETPPDDYLPYREIGDNWYDNGESAVLWAPSVQ